ncbi:hypothetical protein J2754_000386 [Halarchaeum solikamskense]|nr:hypothetical protein [Halarchaeum solikamskense]
MHIKIVMDRAAERVDQSPQAAVKRRVADPRPVRIVCYIRTPRRGVGPESEYRRTGRGFGPVSKRFDYGRIRVKGPNHPRVRLRYANGALIGPSGRGDLRARPLHPIVENDATLPPAVERVRHVDFRMIYLIYNVSIICERVPLLSDSASQAHQWQNTHGKAVLVERRITHQHLCIILHFQTHRVDCTRTYAFGSPASTAGYDD